MFDKQNLLKNISKPDEKLVFSKAFDRAYYCIKNYEPSFTEFLDPYTVSSLLSLLDNKYNIIIKIFGGLDDCERKKIGFFPEFMVDDKFDFPISVIEITYNTKYSRKLSHRDFLGSIIGLGIVRGKIGDIFVTEEKAFVFVDDDIADFININLDKVGNTKVKSKIVSVDDIEISQGNKEAKNITVSSLRIDAVLSAVFNLSRGKTNELIKAKKAFVNWRVCESTSLQVSAESIVTLSGFGRVKIIEIVGKTKKDRFLLSIHKFT